MVDSGVNLKYYDEGWKSVKFCTSDVWVQVKDGKPFGKQIIVQECQDGTIKMALQGGIIGETPLSLSNCPCSISKLAGSKEG